MVSSRISDLSYPAHTVFLLTIDDFLLRKEWGENISISAKELNIEADLEITDLCQDLGLEATLFIPAVAAEKFPKIIRGLSEKNFEIAAHGYRHENLRNLSSYKQRHLFDLSMNLIREIINKDVKGWRSPELYIDIGILMALKQSEIRWCSNIVLPSSVRHFPFINPWSAKIEIPIMSSIDYIMYGAGFTPSKVIRRLLKDLEMVHKRESQEVFTLLVHPWIQVSHRERIRVLKAFLEKVQSMDGLCCLKCSDVTVFLNPMLGSFYGTFLKAAAGMQAIAMGRQGVWRFFQKILRYIG